MNEFAGIIDHIVANEGLWRQWYDHNTPEKEKFPVGYDCDLLDI